jgi:hypothetical protein
MKGKPFSEEEIQVIKAKYADNKTEELAKQLNRSTRSIYSVANDFKLKKSESFLNSPSSGRLQKGSDIGKDFLFEKGHIPPNKGKKLEEFMKPETIEIFKANMYKKGNIPHNAYEDGEETIYTDKEGRQYLKIKVPGIRKLVFKHYVVYSEAFGELQENHIIIFKDGNSLNCIAENLKAITKQENMKRNSIHRFPEELKSVIRLLSKLNKQTQKHEKQN